MNAKLAVCLVILATIASSCSALNAEWDKEWVRFVKTHNKVYKSKIEELHRRSIWEENMKKINEHNHNPEVTFSLKMNQFGDLTDQEFGRKYLKQNKQKPSGPIKVQPEKPKKRSDIPDSVDWRSIGCVGPVVSEGFCDAGWAFAITAAVEGALCIKNGNLTVLSAQQLLDCSTDYGNSGCEDFGPYEQTFEYIQKYGLESTKSYPYGFEDGPCGYQKKKVVAHVKGSVNITAGDEDALTYAVATVGPVAVVVDSSHFSWRFYSGGLYYEKDCLEDSFYEGNAVVGYGSFGDNKDYYIVQNMWGTQWGDKGYIYMSRNRQNNCGIASYATYPIV